MPAEAATTDPAAGRPLGPDRVVVVTGAASGLGAAVAAAAAARGAQVVGIDRRACAIDRVHPIEADLADRSSATAAVEHCLATFGGIDALVTCAGIDVPGGFLDVEPDDWDRVVAVNLFGTAWVVRAALASLLDRRGRVVTVASTLGHRAVSDATAYCASKWGVVGFTRALAAEVKGRVGVTLLTPGGMRTAFFDGRDAQYAPGPDTPLGDPHDVARAVLFALEQGDTTAVWELVVAGPHEGSWPP